MTAVSDAQSALDEGQRLHAEAASNANFAVSRAASLRAAVANGTGETVTVSDLTSATDDAEHAQKRAAEPRSTA